MVQGLGRIGGLGVQWGSGIIGKGVMNQPLVPPPPQYIRTAVSLLPHEVTAWGVGAGRPKPESDAPIGRVGGQIPCWGQRCWPLTPRPSSWAPGLCEVAGTGAGGRSPFSPRLGWAWCDSLGGSGE